MEKNNTIKFLYKWFLKHNMSVYVRDGYVNASAFIYRNDFANTISILSPFGKFLLKYTVNNDNFKNGR